MKVSLLTISLFFTSAILSTINAQQESLLINVSATVQGSIEIETVQSINFSGVEAVGDVLTLSPVQNPNAGKMIARGLPANEFRLEYLANRELTHVESGRQIPFFYIVSGNYIDDQSTSEPLEQEVRDLQFSSEGEFFLWVGGRLNIANLQPGTYVGDFTIDIEYI
ncbi:MAG: hypothetical protein ACNA78_02980 [Balneolaceae bacterium]